MAIIAAVCLVALAGCGGDEPAPVVQSFAPLHYEYLPKIRLNVNDVEVADHSLPVSPQDIATTSPAVPAQALTRMARDRLFPAGTAGTANFVIDQASIVREPNGALDGQLAVHLDLLGAGGVRAGFAEARVARQHVPGSDPEDASATLYDLTRQMMDAMNVELEYQVRHSLQAFLVSDATVPLPVSAQPLDAGDAPAAPPAVPAPPALPPAAPDASQTQGHADPAEAPPVQMSPPPGYLQPPSSTQSLPPAAQYAQPGYAAPGS